MNAMHMPRAVAVLTSAAAFCALAGCGTPKDSIVDTPMLPPLSTAPLNVNTQGAIYQAGTGILLYETPRAQHIGDVLTIRLSESYTGSSSANAQASRDSDITAEAADKSTGRPYELAGMSKITISDRAKNSQTLYLGSGSVQADKYTLPPPAPDGSFDVRFTSGSMVAVYPEDFDASQRFDYPIQITATHYPLTLKWEKAGTDNLLQGTVVVKSDAGRIIGMLTGGGKLTLTDASVRRVILSVSPGTALPRVFALGRNYPNPFNPTTQFTVEMPRQGDVDVSIYDVLGRKLATLLSGSQPAGYHTLEWDSRDGSGFAVASGIYFIRMSVPSEQFVATQKVMLLK